MLLIGSQVIGKARVPIIKFVEKVTDVQFDIRWGHYLFVTSPCLYFQLLVAHS